LPLTALALFLIMTHRSVLALLALLGVAAIFAYGSGLGFGKALFASVRKTLASRSLHGLAVQVLSDNEPARNFYRALGGRLTAKSWYKMGGRRMELSIYTWPGART
ncbi:MAG: GNAT family N-acetyltransferase, partial [Pseudomonadota bacterium]